MRRNGAAAAGRPRWRELDAIVLLDKPPGLGSTPALARVRRLLRAAKAGHAGTLDPMATGMLPLCFGQATKACGTLLGARKAYRASLRLGSATDTGDADGRVLRTTDVPAVDAGVLGRALAALCGRQEQVPPMYSALKHAGRPLYELARRGQEVARAPRTVFIHRLELRRFEDGLVEFDVECSKGTYVRVLGETLAAALGTAGHLAALRRLWVAPFEADSMVSLETIEAWAAGQPADLDRPVWMLPVDAPFRELPRIDLDAEAARHLRQGREIPASLPTAGFDLARAYGPDRGFLGLIGPGSPGRLRVARLFVAGVHGPGGESA